MTKLKFLGAAIALTLSTTAFAAADCCKPGAECCKEKDGKRPACCHDHDKQPGDHGAHAAPDGSQG